MSTKASTASSPCVILCLASIQIYAHPLLFARITMPQLSSNEKNSVADAMISYHDGREKVHRASSSQSWNNYLGSGEKR